MIDLTLTLPRAAVFGAAALACAWDLRTRRIPNVLTFGTALAGLVYHLVLGGASGAGTAVAGWVVGCAFFFLPFALRGLGGGDVKLVGALGAWLGPHDVFWLGLYAGAAGGVMAVVVALANGYLSTAVRNTWLLLTHWRVCGLRAVPDMTLRDSRSPRLAYAVPILAGALVTLWLQ